MKHIWKSALALLLALAMTAGAFGCGSKKDAEEKSTSDRCPFCHLLFWIDHAVGSISQKEFFLNIAFCSCNYQLRTKFF